jgi:regulator of cell morphogenesis and NO signaling
MSQPTYDQAADDHDGADGPGGETLHTESLRTALEREHHAIDRGIEDFVDGHGSALDSASRLREAIAALRRHIYLEERLLFPPLRDSGMLAPVFVMLSEHAELWRTMDDLEQQLDDDTALTDLRAACRTLLAQLERHNAKEEPILYSQADAVLSDDARAELHDFIATESLPEGWVCQAL